MDCFSKIKVDSDPQSEPKKQNVEVCPGCPHGERCYKRSPIHFREFDHPHLNAFLEREPFKLPEGYPRSEEVTNQLNILRSIKKHKAAAASNVSYQTTTSCGKTTNFTSNSNVIKTNSKTTMLEKMQDNSPYYIFFTSIPASVETSNQKNSIKFTDPQSEPKKQNVEVCPGCPHGERCYKRSPIHFREFDHPHLNVFLEREPFKLPEGYPRSEEVTNQLNILRSIKKHKAAAASNVSYQTTTSCGKTTNFTSNSNVIKTNSKTTMLEKMQDNSPYYIFFTSIPASVETSNQKNSIKFTDLLCPSLGELKCSLQINFMIDIYWLIEQYIARKVHKLPLTIIYGYQVDGTEDYIKLMLPNVTSHLMKMRKRRTTHYSKVGLYVYEDNSLRVVVSTANLYLEDWKDYSQGLWVSPLCKALPEDDPDSAGNGETNFKNDFLRYLNSYNLDCLKDWIRYVQRADFSEIKVCFVSSTPGKSSDSDPHSHLQTVEKLLTRYCSLPAETSPESEGPLSWNVLVQASSIGNLGKSSADWVQACLVKSLACHKKGTSSAANFQIVYPSQKNVLDSYEGPSGGGCLPYLRKTHEKQKWLEQHLHQWKADNSKRTRAMPHSKTYCRISPCLTKLAYFLLTSGNISKSAWGSKPRKDNTVVYIRSYQAGVLFLPHFFEEDHFAIAQKFPFIYDLPLTPYEPGDGPWCK